MLVCYKLQVFFQGFLHEPCSGVEPTEHGAQLGQQHITFKPAAALTAEENQSACLVKYAGQALTTGKQAECYAKEFLGLDVKTTGKGRTYAEIGDDQTALRAQIAAAGGAANAPDLQSS